MPYSYNQQSICLDGRLELDISFGDVTMRTVVYMYVKLDAREPLQRQI